MTLHALTDCEIYTNSADLTAQVNGVDLEAQADVEDGTNMGSNGWREKAIGLLTFDFDLTTWLDATTADSVINGVLRSTGQVLTVTEDDAAGSIAYFGRGFWTKLSRKLPVGRIAACDGHFVSQAAEGVIRGSLLLPSTTTGSSSTSSGQQLGAVSSTQKIYAALHVFAASGTLPTLDVIIESDDNSNFTSPTTRITFSQKTTTGFEFSSLAGAITDTYWRAKYTIAGTGPSFTFAVVAGVQ